MGIILNRLAQKKLLVSDGAWGTMLQAKGLQGGDVPEEWNVSHPQAVQSVAQAYANAGCDIILSCTFGGSPAKLEKSGLGHRVEELNAAGAKLSLQGAGQALVAASVGPTGEFCEPLGDLSPQQMEDQFSRQIAALYNAGVQALCIETMSALDEARCAVQAAKKLNPHHDVIVTFTFNPTPAGPRTMMGVSPQQVAHEILAAGADIIGANCGNGIEQMIPIADEFRKATPAPILIHANAGLPELVNGQTLFKQSPNDMARRVKDLVAAGANIIGGCCGTTPQHILAIKQALDPLRN